MSDKNEIPAIKNPNEWIEEAISKRHMKYYDYKHFHNIQQIGNGAFGKIYRANWRNSEDYFALKSLLNPDSASVKEIVREVIL